MSCGLPQEKLPRVPTELCYVSVHICCPMVSDSASASPFSQWPSIKRGLCIQPICCCKLSQAMSCEFLLSTLLFTQVLGYFHLLLFPATWYLCSCVLYSYLFLFGVGITMGSWYHCQYYNWLSCWFHYWGILGGFKGHWS